MRTRSWLPFLALTSIVAAACVPSEHEPPGFQVWESPQTHPMALTPDGSRLYVAHAAGGFVSVIDSNPVSASFHQVIDTVQ
jgi:DNA-binding beta-propeller fold protein YncE